MGPADMLGSIGIAPQLRRRGPATPPFLPPVGPTPTPAPVPSVPAPVQQAQPEGDENYDEYGQIVQSQQPSLSPSPATRVGGIGAQPSSSKFQSADDTLQHTLANPPVRPKTSLWRELGGRILMGADSPIGQTLGSRLAYGKYPQELQEYQANVANQTLAAKQSRDTAEEQRKIEHDRETLAATKDYRAGLAESRKAAGEDRDADRAFKATQSTIGMIGTGATPYTAPPPVTHTTESVVPGMAPSTTTVPSPPTPPDVLDVGGRKWNVPEKARGGMTYLEPAEAKELELTGRLVNGKVEVPTTAYKQAITPSKETANPEAVLLNPGNYTAAQVAEAKRLFREKHRPPTGPDRGQNFIDPSTGKLVRVEPGGDVPRGGVTASGFNSLNVPTSQTRSMAEVAPKVIGFVDRIDALINQQQASLGPLASRWGEFMAGRVGAPNPEFTKLRTDIGLLQTALMRMHVGARGGEQMMEHFRNLIDVSKQSPENLRAALGEIKQYAASIAHAQGVGDELAPQTPRTQQTPTVSTKAQFDALPSGAEYIGPSGKKARKP